MFFTLYLGTFQNELRTSCQNGADPLFFFLSQSNIPFSLRFKILISWRSCWSVFNCPSSIRSQGLQEHLLFESWTIPLLHLGFIGKHRTFGASWCGVSQLPSPPPSLKTNKIPGVGEACPKCWWLGHILDHFLSPFPLWSFQGDPGLVPCLPTPG